MSDTGTNRQALILSGGGANGAYEVGVMKALFNGLCPATKPDMKDPASKPAPLEPDIFVGTSIGAFNAAFLVSQWDSYGTASISDLEKVWLEKLSQQDRSGGNGAFRIMGNPLEFLNPLRVLSSPALSLSRFYRDGLTLFRDLTQRFLHVVVPQEEPFLERLLSLVNIDNFISREPFRELMKETIDLESIRTSKKTIRVAATSWEAGEVDVFTNHDFTDQLGRRIIMASSAIPGFCTAQEVGAVAYVDGSVLENSPLRLGIDRATSHQTLHIIYLDPDVSAIPISYLSNLLAVQYRTQVINWAAKINDDIGDAKNINEAIKSHPPESLSFNLLTIHRYHPRDELGGPLGLLNFRRARIEYLIEHGFQDAVYHDCSESECVFAEEPSLPAAG